MIKCRIYPLTILALASLQLLTQAESTQTLPTLYVDAQQTANIQPVTTYESPVSNLEFEPRVDLQSRNMAEAQGDISIRGGIFEGTGFRVGSATLIDPQTGHYSAELPIAPEMLTRPKILTGSDNALYGFNSTAGTISYGWSQIQDGGKLTIGGGDHDLNFQRIHHGLTGALGESGDWSWGLEAEISRSESDGTIQFGDHNFDRSTGRLQILGPNSQTDFFAGYQSKFFSWSGMYTADRFVNAQGALAPEYENLKTRLFVINHLQSYNEDSYFEFTATHRRNTDNYILDLRESVLALSDDYAKIFPYDHETKVSSLGFSGIHQLNDSLGINYSGQVSADEIRSSSLNKGNFESRTYYKLSLLPEYSFKRDSRESVTVRAGATFDDTNRGSSQLSAISDITWVHTHSNSDSKSAYLSYSGSSQVPGYGAIGGDEDKGMFRSNHDLDRETSQNLELGGTIKRDTWRFEGAIFYRWDDDLSDWTFDFDNAGGEYARKANAVDIETYGVELIASKRWETIEAISSYTFMDKDEDYGGLVGASSFYALNYANHRFTLGGIWTPSEIFQLRIDNEWRKNEDNALRESSDSALFTHFGLSIYPPQLMNMELFFAIDNTWDDDFQDVPGTPGRGDQYSAGLTYSW
jgi:vitamin B12 transporter